MTKYGVTSEIYLTKKYISKDEWLKLINTLSNYNGFLRKWKLIIINDRNQIQYFLKTNCSLPATINNLNSFLLKTEKEFKLPKSYHNLFSLPKIGNNIIDLINYCEIKNKGTFEYLEISFLKLGEEKTKSKIRFYLNKNGKIKRYRMIFAIPTSILSVDFEGNKRYFYKSPPKYLEINKILHLLNTDSNNALLSIDTFPYLQGNFYLSQNNFSFDKHSIIMGSSGCGKSKFISLLIDNIHKNNFLKQKYKVFVIDPHAALENDIGGLGKVIDFQSHEDSIDLFLNNSDDIVATTELLLDLLKSLIVDQFNSKLERVLRHSIHLLLANKSFNFSNLRKVILNLEYRSDLIKKLKYNLPASVIDFFLSDFNDLKTKSYGEAISPIIGFIDEMEMIPVFNNKQNSENLKDAIKNNFLILFSLDRTKLGDKVTKAISGLIMQQLFSIVQNKETYEHIIFIIDEVATIESPILSRYLSEARKYNLSLILAGQYFNQISNDLKNSIFANIINYFIFRVSKLDAILLVDNFNMKIPLDDSRDKKINLLTELNNRECVVRIDSNGVFLPAFKVIKLDYKIFPIVKRTTIGKENNMEESNNSNKLKTNFSLNTNVSLKNILISNSTQKKGVKE